MRKSKKRKVKKWHTPKVLKKSKINLVFSICTTGPECGDLPGGTVSSQ
jgi:hypothetical protein